MLSLLPSDALRATNPRSVHHHRRTTVNSSVAYGLPSELILDIFELGASSDKNTAISLLQATTWSRKLLLPLMYECVSLESWYRVDQFKCTIQSQHRDEIRKSVKRLSIAVGEYPITDILYACQSITSLSVSATLFRRQATCYLPPNLIYSPAVLSPHLTHLVIHGSTIHIQSSTLPRTVTHLVFKDDAPFVGYALKAVLSLPKLTHLAFKVSQQPLPFTPDPSPQISSLLDPLFTKGVSSVESNARASAETPLAASSDAGETPTSMWLIAIMVSPNADTRIVDTLINYRQPTLGTTTATGEESERRPKVNILREQQCEWWSLAEWTCKGGEEAFWRRMDGTR